MLLVRTGWPDGRVRLEEREDCKVVVNGPATSPRHAVPAAPDPKVIGPCSPGPPLAASPYLPSLDRPPVHPTGSTFDSYPGDWLCIAVCLAGLGVAAGGATAGLFPYLVASAAAYQLLGRLWSAAVWLELRTQGS